MKNMNNTTRSDKGRERHTPIRTTSCKLKRKFTGGGETGPPPSTCRQDAGGEVEGARSRDELEGVRERRKPAYAYYSLGDSTVGV
jgi:hypothetical protein